MTSRLIKQGTKRALGIQHFIFKEDFTDCNPNVEMGQIGDISENRIPPLEAVDAEETEPVPEVDKEKLETEAYQKGYRLGEIAGREAAVKEMEATMEKYADSFQEICGMKSTLYEQAEREVVKLAMEVAKKIVNREIQADPNIIQTLVRVALSRVAERTSVTVRLNPVDYKYLMERNGGNGKDEWCDVLLQSDNSIKRGGCLVETSCGDIDARMEEKFRELENAFFEDLK